jgi:hypothetical protein
MSDEKKRFRDFKTYENKRIEAEKLAELIRVFESVKDGPIEQAVEALCPFAKRAYGLRHRFMDVPGWSEWMNRHSEAIFAYRKWTNPKLWV